MDSRQKLTSLYFSTTISTPIIPEFSRDRSKKGMDILETTTKVRIFLSLSRQRWGMKTRFTLAPKRLGLPGALFLSSPYKDHCPARLTLCFLTSINFQTFSARLPAPGGCLVLLLYATKSISKNFSPELAIGCGYFNHMHIEEPNPLPRGLDLPEHPELAQRVSLICCRSSNS